MRFKHLCPFHLYIDIDVVNIDVGNIARIFVVKPTSVANIGIYVGNIQMKRALVT